MRIQPRHSFHSFHECPMPRAVARSTHPCLDTFVRSAASSSPAGQIAASRAQREFEKLQLPPGTSEAQDKFNLQRAEKHEKLRGQIGEVDQKIANVASDPSLSSTDRAKKLAALEQKRAKLAEQIKPPVDMVRVTQEIDGIM